MAVMMKDKIIYFSNKKNCSKEMEIWIKELYLNNTSYWDLMMHYTESLINLPCNSNSEIRRTSAKFLYLINKVYKQNNR